MTTVIGRPAQHARGLARRAFLRAMMTGSGGLAALVAAWYCFSAGSDAMTRLASYVGAGIALAAFWVASESWGKVARARAGIEAEVAVARELRRLGPSVVVNGALIGAGGDCDHVVIGPWLAAVETKHGRGRVRMVNGSLRVGSRKLPRDPLHQARRQAEAVSRLTGRTATPVLCVTEAEKVVMIDGVIVCGLRHLRDVMRALPAIMSASEVERCAGMLTTASRAR